MSWAFGTAKFWQDRLKTMNVVNAVSAQSGLGTVEKVMAEHVSGSVLDIGCGYGRLVDVLPEGVTKYTGIDITHSFIMRARRQYPKWKFYTRDFLDSKFADKEFDWGIAIGMRSKDIKDPEGIEFVNKLEAEAKRVCKNIIYFPSYDSGEYHIVYED